jgi:type II secretory pathway component PulF
LLPHIWKLNMSEQSTNPASFAYQAQTELGQAISGTVDSPAIAEAAGQLQSLQLRVIRLEPTKKPSTFSTFRAEDFLAFNNQLASLTGRGLPLERSLRLMAAEVSSRRLGRVVNEIASELEKGKPLAAAFAAHQKSFPPLYGKLIEAGVRANNLSAMLLNIGRHVEMVQRLRAALWRAAAYPLMVIFALLLLMAFIWFYVMPQFGVLTRGPTWDPFYFSRRWGNAPSMADLAWVLPITREISLGMMGFLALVLLGVMAGSVIGQLRLGAGLVQRVVLRLPLVGPILRWNLLARWCDGLQLGLAAGMDLPAAIALTTDAVDSAALRDDGRQLIKAISGGGSLDSVELTGLIPPLVPAALQLGIEQNDLAATAAMLAKMYQDQAEVRLSILPVVLSPLLLALTAACLALAIVSALLPLITVLRTLMQ